jgi:hypothetical protein
MPATATITNADTLDGYHASDFVLSNSVAADSIPYYLIQFSPKSSTLALFLEDARNAGYLPSANGSFSFADAINYTDGIDGISWLMSMMVHCAVDVSVMFEIWTNGGVMYTYVDGTHVLQTETHSGSCRYYATVSLATGNHRVQFLTHTTNVRFVISPWFVSQMTWLRAAAS